VALDREQLRPQRAAVAHGDGQAARVHEGGDGQRGLGGPAAVDGRPPHAGGGGDALDGERVVAALQEDQQGGGEDRLVAAGVAGTPRVPGGLGRFAGGGLFGAHALLLTVSTIIDNLVPDSCVT